jgi:spermidine synthase
MIKNQVFVQYFIAEKLDFILRRVLKMIKKNKLLHSKTYLYLTEFFAGMAVMAVELGASRLLAPYFSSSQIVWTIIIGTIMIALALGNLWGGRSADRDPNPDRLYRRILIAAVWIAAIPLVGKYIIIAISGILILTVNTSFLTLASFISCMVLFVYPLLLLGTVTPSLAKYCTDNLEDNGRIVGTLGAFNTIGSILGTFLPTFVTIPAVGTSITFLLFSGVLLLLSLLYFLQTGRQKRYSYSAILFFLICSLMGHNDSFAFWKDNLLYEGESVYNYLQVEDRPDSVILSTNVLFGVQSIKPKQGGLTGMYYDYALAAPVLAQNGQTPQHILVLGMGSGTYAGLCRQYFPQAEIEGVEIDGKITALAHRYFDLPASIPVADYDGRAYLAAVDKKYDVIMVDSYQDITIPFYMSSQVFFSLVQDHLTPNGVMVVNMNMHSDGHGSINESLGDTIATVFPQVTTVDVPGATNRILLASQQDMSGNRLAHKSQDLTMPEMNRLMRTIALNMIPYQGGSHILTDDKAPVEILGMQALDNIIEREAGNSRAELLELTRNIL